MTNNADAQIAREWAETRTLADMTPAERADCVGMWATYHGSTSPRPVIIWAVEYDIVWRLSHTSRHVIMGTDLDQITPRFDLPRAWTPDGEPVPGEWAEGHVHIEEEGRSIECQTTGDLEIHY